jgi:LysM repeat protein
MILAVHVVVISGMLLQGCKDTSTKDLAKQDTTVAVPADTAPATAGTTVSTGAPVDMPTTVNPNISNAYVGTTASAGPAPTSTQPMAGVVPPAKPSDLAVPTASGEGKEYVIVKGDTLAVIAHRNGVSLKALTDANPGVNAKKLRIGEKVQIPAGTASLAASSTTGAAPSASGDATPSEGSLYVVKSGDTLTKIAKSHGTSFKRIMAMNDLKSTSIRAGQKLKMPTAKASSTEPTATPAPVSTPASASVVPTTSPMKVSSAVPVTTSPVAAN